MSHSQGAVRFEDGDIRWVEYNGTCDVLQPRMFPSQDMLMACWRTMDWPTCRCPGEDVEIAVSYGGGFSWKGKACRINDHNCVKQLTPEDGSDYHRGLPDWYPNRELYE